MILTDAKFCNQPLITTYGSQRAHTPLTALLLSRSLHGGHAPTLSTCIEDQKQPIILSIPTKFQVQWPKGSNSRKTKSLIFLIYFFPFLLLYLEISRHLKNTESLSYYTRCSRQTKCHDMIELTGWLCLKSTLYLERLAFLTGHCKRLVGMLSQLINNFSSLLVIILLQTLL